jgi:holo-[acyl-carrier protein] synthase
MDNGELFNVEVGVDLVEIRRFRALDYPNHKSFYDRIFTRREIEYCLSFKKPAEHFAVTFAGKEAVYKAINNLINIELQQIEIVRDGNGPRVNLRMKDCIGPDEANAQVKVKVSLSHTSSYAVAFALATSKETK